MSDVETPASPGPSRDPNEFVTTSTLAADAETLWRSFVDPAGVNREFRPLLRMTFPDGVRDLTAGWQPGVRQGRSWLLLGGVLPVEYDDLCFVEVEPGRRFLERSTMLSQRIWEHERRLEPVPGGTRVSDRIRFEPRVAWLAPVQRRVFRAVFRWRHRNLRRRFGQVAGA